MFLILFVYKYALSILYLNGAQMFSMIRYVIQCVAHKTNHKIDNTYTDPIIPKTYITKESFFFVSIEIKTQDEQKNNKVLTH